jgi:hypothetical protein
MWNSVQQSRKCFSIVFRVEKEKQKCSRARFLNSRFESEKERKVCRDVSASRLSMEIKFSVEIKERKKRKKGVG